MSEHIERDIEAALEARTGRECVFMPSGRFAIHLAFRLLLSPGDRILMSPLEDDTVFFGALAAGLRPVMAPVSTDDGNMRADAIDDATWSTISAVLTGNTYGLPDPRRRAQRNVRPARDSADRGCRPRARDGHRRASHRELRRCLGLQLVEALPRARRRSRARPGGQPPGRRPIARSADAAEADWQPGGRPRAIGGQGDAGDPPPHAERWIARATLSASRETRPVAGAAARASAGARAFQRRPRRVRRVDGDGISGLPDATAIEPPEADAGRPA